MIFKKSLNLHAKRSGKVNIWKNDIDLIELNEGRAGTLAEFLEMEYTEIGEDFLSMRMPVISKTKQPYGLLHGGASAALAETVGSVAAWLCIDSETKAAVGLEINCNHVRGVSKGFVLATARPLHRGATTHVWDIKINDDHGRLICISRLTVAIIPTSLVPKPA